MKELRIDTITNDIIIFASDRAKRPLDKVKKEEFSREKNEYEENCPFCRGNEHIADEATEEIRDETGWIARSVYNKYPILDYSSDEIFGTHEVIVENYRHDATFYDMSEEEFIIVFKMYINRYKHLMNEENIEYVNLFKNFLRKAGASLMHPHSQIMSMSVIPPEIINELLVAKDYYNINGSNIYEDIVNDELEYGKRIVYSGKKFTAMIPYASKNPGEIRIIFDTGVKLENLKEDDIAELAYAFKGIFRNFEKLYGFMPFNICVHTHPIQINTERYFNMHMHIFPRKFNFGGFELGTDMYVCSSIPEETAQFMKVEKR